MAAWLSDDIPPSWCPCGSRLTHLSERETGRCYACQPDDERTRGYIARRVEAELHPRSGFWGWLRRMLR